MQKLETALIEKANTLLVEGSPEAISLALSIYVTLVKCPSQKRGKVNRSASQPHNQYGEAVGQVSPEA